MEGILENIPFLLCFSIPHHSYLNLWQARALQVSPVHIRQVVFGQHPSRRARLCAWVQDKHISQYYIQRDECLFFVVLSNMVIHGYFEYETVVSKRIFADKCASENSHFIQTDHFTPETPHELKTYVLWL